VSVQIRRDFLEEMAGPISDEQISLLSRYSGILLDASDRMNLMSRGQLERLSEHVMDAAAVLRVVEPRGLNCADLGSGGGLPGVVLAVLRPEARITLIDSRRSKIVVLKRIQRELALSNMEIVHERIESLPVGTYDLGFSRAVGSAQRTLAASLRLIGQGGRLILYKGPGWVRERAAMAAVADREGAELRRAVEVPLPGTDRVTTFVEFHVERHERA